MARKTAAPGKSASGEINSTADHMIRNIRTTRQCPLLAAEEAVWTRNLGSRPIARIASRPAGKIAGQPSNCLPNGVLLFNPSGILP